MSSLSKVIKAHYNKEPLKVLITGGAGNIAYSLAFMVARGNMLGEDQPIILCLLELPQIADSLKGVEMELKDCALPLVVEIIVTTDEVEAFKNADIALLVGAKPRSKGMERKDLLEQNAAIFKKQANLLDTYSKPTVKVCVVGNPANTNAAIIASIVKNIPKTNITALTRLDHNRAIAQVSEKLQTHPLSIRNVIIWGNHSLTQYPDLQACELHEKGSNKSLILSLIKDQEWIQNSFIPKVQKRGGEIIELRKLSSAASAASAICDHIRNWVNGTSNGEFVSMAVLSDGNTYGVPKDLIFSFPVTCKNGEWKIVENMNLSDSLSKKMIQATIKELLEEREMALQSINK